MMVAASARRTPEQEARSKEASVFFSYQLESASAGFKPEALLLLSSVMLSLLGGATFTVVCFVVCMDCLTKAATKICIYVECAGWIDTFLLL